MYIGIFIKDNDVEKVITDDEYMTVLFRMKQIMVEESNYFEKATQYYRDHTEFCCKIYDKNGSFIYEVV